MALKDEFPEDSLIKLRSHDEEWGGHLQSRIAEAVKPAIEKLDLINEEYLITITIERLP